jgi:hypothetical protein
MSAYHLAVPFSLNSWTPETGRLTEMNERPIVGRRYARLNVRLWVFFSIACLNERPVSRSSYVKPPGN